MSDTIDAVVIGAGVVGLAVARALALAGREVIVLEKNRAIGEETSARNSEVIHAGLYYPTGSLKARLCVAGKEQLYAYCDAKNVPHRRCGKVLVAVHAAQRPKLDAILATATANGVTDLERLSAAQVQRLEPAVRADSGLWSPSTGIVDSHSLMLALRGDLEQAGGAIAVLSRCLAGNAEPDAWRLECATESGPVALRARVVVNAAGLHATRVARSLQPTGAIPEAIYAKGNYFTYAGRGPFTHLVYPLPEEGGLGVHATIDLAGRVRFGPDVEWLDRAVEPDALDYEVDVARAESFYGAIRTFWPELPDGGLQPAYAGVRPKVGARGQPATDFDIRLDGAPPGPLAVHLFGIESPGLTAALAIGGHVAQLLASDRGTR